MYAKLQFSTNWTPANLLADLILALTGTTDVNTMSSSLDKPNSFVNVSSRVAGWTVHDSAAGSGTTVITAPCVSGNNKYVRLGTSGNNLTIQAYESWNATTHTGTNPTAATTTPNASGAATTTQSIAMHVSSSNRHFAVTFYNITTVTPNGILGGVWEYVRTGIYDTGANAYPNFVQSGTGAIGVGAAGQTGNTDIGVFQLCRMLDCSSLSPTDLTTTNANAGIVTPFGNTAYPVGGGVLTLLTVLGNSTTTAQTFNASLVKSHQLIPFGAINTNRYNILGDISSLADMYFTTTSFGSAFDEVLIGSNTYIIWTAPGGTVRMAVRKG